MEESHRIKYAGQDDLDAFNCLALIHQDLIFNYAFRMLGEQEAAECVTQKTFQQAYLEFNLFQPGCFHHFLLRIASHLCCKELDERENHLLSMEPVDQLLSPAGNGGQEELGLLIRQSLKKLPPEFRSVAILVDFLGFNYCQAAEILEIPPGSVKDHLAKARMLIYEQSITWQKSRAESMTKVIGRKPGVKT